MKRTNLDLGWRFQLDGGEETTVNLPHDFTIGRPRRADSPMREQGGFFEGGNGVYRKTLTIPEELRGGTAMLEVEGAYMNAEVYVNGNIAAFNPYGYTSFHADLTPYLKPDGGDELEIRVQNDALPNTRWYSGGGLYRHVWLLTAKGAAIRPWGVFVTTPEVSQARSVVRVETDITGGGLLRHTLFHGSRAAAGGRTAAGGRAAANGGTISGGGIVASSEMEVSAGVNVQELAVEDARLWSPDSPALYTLRSELIVDGEARDAVETVVGIRSVVLDRERGFLLNGVPLKLKGGCVHHDCGLLGAAAYDRAEERKVAGLKAAGFNAARCAHNPPSPAFLDACDRLGMVVMDEAFDCWRMGKTAYDYHLYFDAWWRRDIQSMVLRDRNHPSVAFWSTGNEIHERFGASGGYDLARQLADAVRALDGTRFVSNALCDAWGKLPTDWGAATAPFAAPLDVVGYNYLWQRVDEDLEKYPERFIYQTETVARDAFENWAAVEKHARVIGDCVWTGMDYIGEAGIGHAWLPGEDGRTHGLKYPWLLANCGDLDICCRPRPQSYYRQILWGSRAAPWIAVHRPNEAGLKPEFNFWGWGDVQHSWSWPGCEGYKTYIDVYSAGDEVELFLNGKSLGRQKAGKAARNTASFEATYEPGELKAVAYKNGKPDGTDDLATCGRPAAIRLEADRAEIGAAWGDLSYVTATVVDEAGNIVPYARNALYLAAAGAGDLAAAGTNDPLSEEPYVGNRHSAFEGTVVAILRSNGTKGNLTLTAAADGLRAAQITIQAK